MWLVVLWKDGCVLWDYRVLFGESECERKNDYNTLDPIPSQRNLNKIASDKSGAVQFVFKQCALSP